MSEELKNSVKEKVQNNAESTTESENHDKRGEKGEDVSKNAVVLTEEEKKRLKEEAKEILEKSSSGCVLEEKLKLNDKNKNIYSKIKSFFTFEQFEFLEQSDKKKEEIALLIKAQNNPDKLYWMEILLSTLIATFGLLQNSVAVIIGAMLIAPLIRPMQGMSFAMARGQSRFFWKTTSLLFKSVVISIIVSFLFALLIPLKIEQPEILARTSPNILDLFIAIFSAIIALLSLGYERLSASVAGVAMAASLMPPLAVVGIELSLGNPMAAWGSFLLFFVNFLAILLVGVVVLLAYGFTPTQELKKQVSVRKILTLLVIILFTSIPLYSSLSTISDKIEVERASKELLEQLIPEKIQDAKLKGLKVLEVTEESIKMVGELQVPENIKIFNSTKIAIISDLESHFNKEVIIDFETIRTANFSSPDVLHKLKKEIIDVFTVYLSEVAPNFTLLQVSAEEVDESVWKIIAVVSVPDGEFLTDEIQKLFEQKFVEQFDKSITFKWVTVAGSPRKENTKPLTTVQIVQADIMKQIQEFLSRPDMKGIKLENIVIDIDVAGEDARLENIYVSARVLYEVEMKDESPRENDDIRDVLSELWRVSSDVSTQEIKKVNDGKVGSDESSIREYFTEDFVQMMQSLPYENIHLNLEYIPYSVQVIDVSQVDKEADKDKDKEVITLKEQEQADEVVNDKQKGSLSLGGITDSVEQ